MIKYIIISIILIIIIVIAFKMYKWWILVSEICRIYDIDIYDDIDEETREFIQQEAINLNFELKELTKKHDENEDTSTESKDDAKPEKELYFYGVYSKHSANIRTSNTQFLDNSYIFIYDNSSDKDNSEVYELPKMIAAKSQINLMELEDAQKYTQDLLDKFNAVDYWMSNDGINWQSLYIYKCFDNALVDITDEETIKVIKSYCTKHNATFYN